MTEGAQRTFRSVALQRAASPEQLDHLVSITKPSDWILTFVVCLALAAALIWGIFGRDLTNPCLRRWNFRSAAVAAVWPTLCLPLRDGFPPSPSRWVIMFQKVRTIAAHHPNRHW